MVGSVFPSEMKRINDSLLGTETLQLTTSGINYHMYFTENSFDIDGKEIYFLSNKGNDGKEIFNIFYMDLQTGEMIQLTDDTAGVTGGITKTPDSELIAYITGHELRVYNTRTKENICIYTDPDMDISSPSISCDKRKIGFVRNEDNDVIYAGPNYTGFEDKMFAIKDGRISVCRIDGSGFYDVVRDTHWVGHFQFSPDDPDVAMFCHEGPWNEVDQRIWITNIRTRDFWPCFRQGKSDCVGHEFWTKSGDIIFDNRRDGHDGTISSNKIQVYAKPIPHADQKPYFGFAHKDGTVYRKIKMPFYCNHYFANYDLSLFVGDAVDDLVLIKPDETGNTRLIKLLAHNTTWAYQRSHCHPTFSYDGRKILYAADTDRWHDNLFLVRVPDNL